MLLSLSTVALVGVAIHGVNGAVHNKAAGPPQPFWSSPAPYFPTSWFGANMHSFEYEDPTELAVLKKYKHVLASWPELVLATNFTNSTQVAIEDATRMKALLGPGTFVGTYQSGWVAAAFYNEARVYMDDPAYSDFFLKDANGSFLIYDGYCSQVGVTAEEYPTCIGYYWNWCNGSAVDHYVNNVLHAMVASPSGSGGLPFDGVFLDNTEGFSPRHTSNANCDASLAVMNVHIETGKMFQKYNKWPIFSLTSTGTKSAEVTQQLWAAGIGFSKFYEYYGPTASSIEELYNDTVAGVPTVVHTPTGVKRHPGIPCLDGLAAYLVAAGGATHSYFEYSSQDWVNDKGWAWCSPYYDYKYGAATGPLEITKYGVNKTETIYTRSFASGAVARVNCTPGIAWCIGNVTIPSN